MKTCPFLLHALSPLHAGTGYSAGLIDLPTARMKATGIPFVPGSSVKGVLRDARRATDREKTEATFGPSEDPGAHAGALVVSDARLLALPVRSFRGTFAWVTSPLLLVLAKRDLDGRGGDLPIPTIEGYGAQLADGGACSVGGRLYLEDLDLVVGISPAAGAWASFLAPLASPGHDIFGSEQESVND